MDQQELEQSRTETLAAAKRSKPVWREYGEAIIIALALALVIRAFVFQAFSIPSGSMKPTLLIGDYLLVNKFIYGIRNPLTNKVIIPISSPQQGDIVVFLYPQDPSKDYIKRVIGVAGDKIQIINKHLYVNDQPVEMPQAVYEDPRVLDRPDDPPRDNFGPVTVPQDHLFVMGDNRDFSYDSRFWGFVPMDSLRGKACIIYWSWDSQDHSLRWRRLGMLIN
ncbi:MAG: signal peptidase I [Desulfobacca sp. 4484_104]|nr:MAG: signal peptidase I [Desulfobacca sp. 4484_104]RLA89985.1 MAG: signal peptidase I [Deltaproteobacteria bacterium]